MNHSANTVLVIGYALTCVLIVLGFLKKLRNDRRIILVVTISIMIAAIGFLLRSDYTRMTKGNAADSFLGPLIYIISYAFLRKIYKKKYSVEPTYDKFSWFDREEGRRQNWLDLTVHMLPMVLSLIAPILIG